MASILIGVLSGILIILFIGLLTQLDKKVMYGLILAGIGFLYIGFTWSDLMSVIISSIQAIAFLMIAYYGMRKSMYVLALGYFLHGAWDLLYNVFSVPYIVPPHYHLFCLSLDWTIGVYLLAIKYRKNKIHHAKNLASVYSKS